MAAIDTNPELLLRAFLETIKDLFPEPVPFLKQLRNRALTGSAQAVEDVLGHLQDWGATNLQQQGSATQWMRELSAGVIAQLCQASLDTLALEEEAGGAVPGGNLRFADFSGSISTLG